MGEGFPVKTFVPRIKQFLCTRDGALFMALLIGAVAIRIPLMQFPGYYADLSNYVAWGEVVNQHFTAIYTTLPTPVTNGGGFPGGDFPGGNGGFPGGGGGFPGGNGGFP